MSAQRPPQLPLLIALSALAVLPGHIFVPSIPSIVRDLHTDFALVNAAIALYAVASGAAHLVAGALSDRFGRKPIALGALVLFTAASVGCSIAGDIRVFLLCRMLQGTVIACYAISLASIRDTSSQAAAASRIGYLSAAWAVLPMIGPTLGGMLDAGFGWRSNFVVLALLGVLGLYLVQFQLAETHHTHSDSRLPQLRAYRELIGTARFVAYAFCMAFGLGTFYVFLGGAPLVALQMGETSTTALGLYMGLVPAGFILGSYAVGRLQGRRTAPQVIVAGRALTCLGLLVGLALAAAGAVHPLAFFGPCVAIGLGNGLTMPTANARVLFIHPSLAGTASGLATAITVMGAGAINFASGLVIDASNARIAVLAAMLVTSSLSLAAGILIGRFERQATPLHGIRPEPGAGRR